MKTIILFLICLFFVPLVYGHPPANIDVNYDPETKIVKVIITHKTSNPKTHYIKKVDISLNDKEIITHNISSQDDNEIQVVSYRIPEAKADDLIAVEGYCRISGTLTKQVYVPKK